MSPRSVITPAHIELEAAAKWCLRLAEGRLEPSERSEFEAWLAADSNNPGRLERVAATWQGVEAYAGAPEMLTLRAQAMDTARRAHSRQWLAAILSGRERIAAGLVLALMVTAAAVGWGLSLAPHAYRTGIGERRVVVLSDGSRVSLDASTEVRVRFTGERRRLWLEQGRAKFDVAKNPLRPFSVQAGAEVVVATGTSFSVEMVNRQVRVVLYEGHVAVLEQSSQGSALRPLRVGAQRLTTDAALTPGHELVSTSAAAAATSSSALAGGAVAQITDVDPVRSHAWESGQLVFDDEPLATAVERVNRYSDQKVVVGDARAGGAKISGVFNAGDTSAFVDAATQVLPVRAEALRDGRVRIVAATKPPRGPAAAGR